MTDGTSRETKNARVDLSRLTRPESETFRHIAEVLGARYAGDDHADETDAAAGPAPPQGCVEAGQGRSCLHDPRGAALLEKLPLPLLVTEQDGVAFINRAARKLLGYDTAGVMDAAGGLATLFTGRAAAGGAVTVTSAIGTTFRARVEMTPIDWADQRAVLVSVQPLPERPAAEADTLDGRDPDVLREILSANPDPIAIITRGGVVEAANAAYEALAPGEDLGLEQRLGPHALEAILLAAAEAFRAPDGAAVPASPVSVGAQGMSVSVGIVRGTGLACIVFRPLPEESPTAPEEAQTATNGRQPPRDGSEGALDRAVETARRLMDEAAVMVDLRGGPPLALEGQLAQETERFFQAMLVSIGARVPAGTRITVDRRKSDYAIALDPVENAALDEVHASSRLVLYGLEAGLAVSSASEGQLAIAPLVGEGSHRSTV